MNLWVSIGFLFIYCCSASAQPAAPLTSASFPPGKDPSPDKATCEFIVAEMTDGANSYGMFKGCWTGRHLYIPADSLASKLGFRIEKPADAMLLLFDKVHELRLSTERIKNDIGDEPDAYQTASTIFLRDDIIEEALQIQLAFRYRDMKLWIETPRPLPKQLQMMRNNRVFAPYSKAELYPDVKRSRKLWHPGILAWNIGMHQSWNSDTYKNGYYGQIRYGTELLGGSFTINIPIRDGRKISNEEIDARWRWDFSDKPWIETISAGNLSAHLNQFYAARGFEISNKPVYPRRYFHEFTYSGTLSPEWELEIHQNNHWLAWEKYATSPNFEVRLPLQYGQNDYMLRWYSPLGLERVERFSRRISGKQIRPGKMEYRLQAGELQHYKRPFFAAFDASYGWSPRLSAGLHIWSVGKNSIDRSVAAAELIWSAGKDAFFVGSVATDGSTELTFDFRPSQHGYSMISFKKNATQTWTGHIHALSELRLSHQQSIHLRKWNINAGSMSIVQDLGKNRFWYQHSQVHISHGKWSFQSSHEIQSHITSAFQLSQHRVNQVISRILGQRTNVSVSAEYDLMNRKYSHAEVRTGLGSQKSQISISLRHDAVTQNVSMWANLRFRFTGTEIRSVFQRHGSHYFQSAETSGSLLPTTHSHPRFDYTIHNERSGAEIISFVDSNNNGNYDPGETIVKDMKYQIENAGRLIASNQSTFVLYTDLHPLTTYKLRILPTAALTTFQPVQWEIDFVAEPNRFTPVYVPLVPTRELILTFATAAGNVALGGISVALHNTQNGETLSATSYSDGVIYVPNITPGTWQIILPEHILERLQLQLKPDSKMIHVTADNLAPLKIQVILHKTESK